MSEIKEEVIKTMATLITTAFGLIAALAWNEAIKALIQLFFKAGNALTGLFVYAIIVTILAYCNYNHRKEPRTFRNRNARRLNIPVF
ncbi:DUF5654 family protein [Methanothermobacter tenebrarum]